MSLAYDIASALSNGKPERNGDGYTCRCPVHNDKHNSMSIKDDGNGDVIVHCFTGCNWKDIKDRLCADGLLPEWKPGNNTNYKTTYKPNPELEKKRAKEEAEKLEKRVKGARWIWKQSSKDDLSHARKYFDKRGLTGDFPLGLKWNSYNDKETGKPVNLIVLAASMPGDKSVHGIQRLFIDTEDHTKTGENMLGDMPGRGVWFDRHGDMEKVIVGEGWENTWSGVQVMEMNGVAALTWAQLEPLVLPEETKEIYILVDSDKVRTPPKPSAPGQKASLALARKFENSRDGRKAFLVTPDDSCYSENPKYLDFNDLLQEDLTGKSIKERFEKATPTSELAGWEPPGKDDDNEKQPVDDGGRYPEDALQKLHEFNKKHALVIMSGDARITMEEREEHKGRVIHSVQFLKQYALNAYYANERIFVRSGKDGALECKELAKEWWTWDQRATYKGIIFDPSETVTGNKYNLFKGFPYHPKKGDWSLMHRHIKDVICCGVQEHYEYLMAWMARIVQDPGGDRPGVAIVLKGGKGIGKGSFVGYFGDIFGEAFLPIADAGNFTGRFNMHLSKAVVTFLDEAVWGGDKRAEGKLKQIITEPQILFEPKGIDSVTMDNHINVIIASNEDWAVPATGDERRFFVLEPSPAYAKNTEYFGKIKKERFSGGIEAMMYDLLHWDYSRVDLRKAPVTNGLVQQVQESLPSILRFWLEVLSREFLLSERETGAPVKTAVTDVPGNDDQWPVLTYKYEVFNEYERWCKAKSERYPAGERKFWKETWPIWPGGNPGRLKKDGTNALVIPGLDECKDTFSAHTKIKFNKSKAESADLAQFDDQF